MPLAIEPRVSTALVFDISGYSPNRAAPTVQGLRDDSLLHRAVAVVRVARHGRTPQPFAYCGKGWDSAAVDALVFTGQNLPLKP